MVLEDRVFGECTRADVEVGFVEDALNHEQESYPISFFFQIQMVFVAYCDNIPELQELAKINREMLLYIIDNEAMIKRIIISC